ncbi:fungal specific transcription factor [Colletotrichum higginsianum]|nr:fungal specific transcription factor [Colletotrichum higginsianum]
MSMITTASQAQVPPVLTDEHPSDDAVMDFVDGINFETTQSEFEAMFRSPRALSSTPATAWTSNTPRQLRRGQLPPGANPQLLGLSGDMDPLLLRHYRFDEGGMFGSKELAVHSVQSSPLPCHFLVSQQSIFSRRRDECGLERPDDETLSRQLQDIVPAAVGRRLVSLCMDFVQPLFPIFSTAEPPDPATAPTYLLAAIYAISLPFAVHDDKLSVDVAYDKPPYPALSRIVDSALSYELHSPSVPVVQTLLLLILRPSADPLVADTAYRRDALGRLVSCATTLGLHHDPSEWPMTDGRKAHRRRLSFTVYAVDQWIASSHGTPSSTHRDNWLVTNVKPGDFVDSGLGSHDESRLIDFATITEVLGSALSSLYPREDDFELSARRNIKTCTRALTDVIQDLNPDTDGVFWPSWTQLVFSSVCFTLMTMAVSSPDAEEASAWIADLQSTRRGLRLKVASFPFLRLGLLRIDALFWRGITTVLDLRPHVEEAFRAADLV